MALVLVVTLLVGLEAPAPALLPATGGSDECWTQPLQLTLPELAGMGGLANQLRRSHCLNQPGGAFTRYLNRPFTVGQMRLGKVSLFGESIGYGADVIYRPGLFDRPDSMYVVPAVDLPDRWALAIDRATYPALAVGSAAMITYVIMTLVH